MEYYFDAAGNIGNIIPTHLGSIGSALNVTMFFEMFFDMFLTNQTDQVFVKIEQLRADLGFSSAYALPFQWKTIAGELSVDIDFDVQFTFTPPPSTPVQDINLVNALSLRCV